MDDAGWLKLLGGAFITGSIGAFWKVVAMIKDLERETLKRDRDDAAEMRGKIAVLHERINGSATREDLTLAVSQVRGDVKEYRREASEHLDKIENRIMSQLERMEGKK